MEKKPKPKYPPTTVRLPPPLHEEVKEAAAIHGRSMNDEIILRLGQYSIAARLTELEQQSADMRRMLQLLIDRTG